MEECSTSARLDFGDVRPKISAMRKCASTPTLRTLGAPAATLDGQGMEVYIVIRSFQEFGKGFFNKLPGPIQEGVRDCGLCHYMTVFRQPDGTFVQFDFGPKAGGDIHIGNGPLARLLSKAPVRRKRNSHVEGDVREHKLAALPPAHMYVGRTPLSISDIRAWNSVHAQIKYELHRSDCRHYVNSLVHYTTGVEQVASTALRHQWHQNRQKYGLASRVVQLGQFFTDVANWGTVKAIGQASMATLMTFTGQKAFTGMRAPVLLQKMRTRLLPAARHTLVPVRRAITNRPVAAVGTAAVATYAASNGSTPAAIKETVTIGARVAGGVQQAVRAAAGFAQTVGRQAAQTTQNTTSTVGALASGIAGVATRGAATVMAASSPRRVALAPATANAAGARPGTSPQRVTLGLFRADKAQQLALVASRR